MNTVSLGFPETTGQLQGLFSSHVQEEIRNKGDIFAFSRFLISSSL